MDTQTPDNSFVRFLRSKAAIPVGFVLALALGIFFMYQGIDKSCCIGALLIAVLMFLLLKFFNSKSTKLLVVFAVLFFVASTLIGAFAFSSPYYDQQSDCSNYSSSNFTDLEIIYNADSKEMTVTVSYTGEGTNITTYFRPVSWISYKYYNCSTDEQYTHTMAETSAGSHIYTSTFAGNSSTLYDFGFIAKNADGQEIDKSATHFYATTGLDKTMFCLQWNAYWSCIPAIIFVLIAIITFFLRKRLEKERKKMEADGRLYPEGYGRCKQCGSIVLPGEVTCRKCGAYIDVPDNLKVKKVDSFQCSDCGAEVPGDAKVCPKCGAKFDDETETVIVESAAVQGQQNTMDTFQCTDCGATVPADATFCPKCGSKFDDEDENEQPARKCPACGTEVPDYANNCHKCGARLDKKR